MVEYRIYLECDQKSRMPSDAVHCLRAAQPYPICKGIGSRAALDPARSRGLNHPLFLIHQAGIIISKVKSAPESFTDSEYDELPTPAS